MGLFDFFRRPKPANDEELAIDPLHDLILPKLRVGFMLDFDDKTWEVTAYHRYEFDQQFVDEWELTHGRVKRYLERGGEDDDDWSWSQKIPIGALDGNLRQHIIDHDDPPDRITYKGTTYYLDESVAGYFYKDGNRAPQELIKWEFEHEDEEHFVTIEQWGETEFEAAEGRYVEEYQFTNILPYKQD